MEKYFVILSPEDPGSEHDSWEEASDVIAKARAKGSDMGMILPAIPMDEEPSCNWDSPLS